MEKNSNNPRKTGENCRWSRHGNQLRQKQNPRQQHQVNTINHYMDEWENAGRSGSVQIPMIRTNPRRNFNKGSKDQTGASTLSQDKANNTLSKQHYQFAYKESTLQSLALSILICGCDSWTLTADLEGLMQAFKTNATGECLACHRGSIKHTNLYGNRPISSPDVRSFYCQK